MKNFAIAVLLAAYVLAREDMDEKALEPDMSQFPDEWTSECRDRESCERSEKEVMQYDRQMMEQYKIWNPYQWTRRAYCRM